MKRAWNGDEVTFFSYSIDIPPLDNSQGGKNQREKDQRLEGLHPEREAKDHGP